MAFYDAAAHHDTAVDRGRPGHALAGIARALVKDIRNNLSVDSLSREPVRARLRTRIRRVRAMLDHPPEEEREAGRPGPQTDGDRGSPVSARRFWSSPPPATASALTYFTYFRYLTYLAGGRTLDRPDDRGGRSWAQCTTRATPRRART
ncbi:DUF3387 domain-containing protein [Streptomyces sp. B21-097]